jgi:DNA repair exonuclease SbcCD ATPase subunit
VITIAQLGMRNWICFKGSQTLKLTPTFYAVVAEEPGDPERSNWHGKSSLLAAIDWALWGRKPEHVRTKGDLITWGEKSMEVALDLSDGHQIKRTLGSSAPEKLYLFEPGKSPEQALMGDEAQAAIARVIGLSKEDFLLCYVTQGAMARMVHMDPGPRMDVVGSWIGLGPLEACEDEAAGVLGEFSRRIDAKRREKDAALAVIAAADPEASSARTFDARIFAASEEIAERARECTTLREAREKEREREQLEGAAVRYDAIVREGSELAKSLAGVTDLKFLVAAEQAAGITAGVAGREHDRVRDRTSARFVVSAGRFDGTCPIAGKACPTPEFVTRETLSNVTQRDADAKELEQRERVRTARVEEHHQAREAVRRREHAEQRLRDLREEARRLKLQKEKFEALGGALAPSHDMSAISSAELALEQVRRHHAVLVGAAQQIAAKTAQVEVFDGELVQLEAAARVAGAAVAIFGKGGAQRRMAEGALADMEERANADVLGAAGVALSVKVVWSRETQGLAAACGQCGAAFPASRRARQCERCGAERGPQLQNKLELEPSARSGAADDLAGFAFQVGASAWLREDRLAGWGVAMLDEPLGQCDVANRKLVSAHLPGILARAGFGQGLVIAHHASILDALPSRIRIVSDGKHSTASVVG